MTIVAKFRGTCWICDREITPGQRIEWDKSNKRSAHAACEVPVEAPVVARFAPTSEQEEALALFATGGSLAIEAGAGTGKTSTLILIAESAPGRRGQYLAFNNAIVKDSKARFPRSVECNTAHSLAMRAVGHQYRAKLNGRRMKSIEIARALGIEQIRVGEKKIGAGFLGGLVMESIRFFCQSADLAPDERHVPWVKALDADANDAVRATVAPILPHAWADLMSDRGVLRFTHDHYLKAWHLSGPKISADYILFDEAQDANPVMVAIVAAQTHAQLVWVGDSQQQIYSFTGAVNALAQVPADRRAFLTQSFRFGPAVADVANSILDTLDAELRLRGTDSISSRVESLETPDAILCRTNATAVRTVLNLMKDGLRPLLVGGATEVVRFAKAARDLQTTGSTEHPELACFDSWGEVKTYVQEDEQGEDLRLLVKLIEDFSIETILETFDRDEALDEKDADVLVSTAHKAKGREWNRVQLAGDFPTRDKIGEEERRLLYVAVTRAKISLDIEAVEALEEWATLDLQYERDEARETLTHDQVCDRARARARARKGGN